jgi:hypothetical protein
MPKRKAVQQPSIDGSDLSPPPNDLDEGAAALANANADLDSSTQPTKKRKTASSIVNGDAVAGATNGVVATTQKRTARTRKVKPEPEPDEEEEVSSEEVLKSTPKKRQSKAQAVQKEEVEEEDEVPKPLPKGRARKKPQVKEEAGAVQADSEAKPAKKKRKTKEEKEAEAMPLSARTIGHKLFIGAHVSSAGGQLSHIQLYSTVRQSHPQRPHVQVLNLVSRCPKCTTEQRPHRCQCFRTLPQIATQMGKSTTTDRSSRRLPRQLQTPLL